MAVLMRITNVSVRGLFGLFSYDIPLKMHDRITIVHGPNGCGKTTILRALFNLFAKRFREVSSIGFDEFSVDFDDGQKMTVARVLNEQSTKGITRRARLRSQHNLEFSLPSDPQQKAWKWVGITEPGFPLEAIEANIPFLSRIEKATWLDQRTDEVLTLEEIAIQFGDQLPFLRKAQGQEMPAWLKTIVDKVEVHFIQTQRLLRLGTASSRATADRTAHRAMVLEYSEEAIANIRSALAESVQQSQVLDRNFPVRVLKGQANADVTTDQVRARYQEQEKKRKRLEAAGLISWQMEVALPDKDLETLERKLLWLYLDDTDKKLAVFDLLLQKIEFLTEMINARFLHKSFKIDRERGFVFTTAGGTGPAALIPLEALSSGEQHELVLSFELLFRVKSGSFILIDEPELSLHVGWQHRFLEDLSRISELAGLDFLVATHSPQIIHKRWDLALTLGETE